MSEKWKTEYQELMNLLGNAFLHIKDQDGKTKDDFHIPDSAIKSLEDPNVNLDKLVEVVGLGGDWTPLSLAVKARRPDIIQKMLDRGANVNQLDSAKYSALLGAAMAGREEEARLLLTNGADPTIGAAQSDDCMYYAAGGGWVGLTKLLVLSGGSIASAERGVTTALHKLGDKDEGEVSNVSGMKHVRKVDVMEIQKFLHGDAVKIQANLVTKAKAGGEGGGSSAALSSVPAASISPSPSAASSTPSAPSTPSAASGSSASSPTPTGQVMISYCWDNQPLALLVQKELVRLGYKVWIDVEQMEGSILSAMAEALEESSVVLVCISESYAKSANCRLEAEYCMKLRMPFVPLMMQKNYNPTGWLGISLGSKLYYAMHEQASIPSKIKEFLPFLQKFTSPGTSTGAITPVAEAVSAPVPSAAKMDEKALRGFLKEHGCSLQGGSETFTGKDALELWRLSTHVPQLFTSLVRELAGNDPVQALRMTAALRQLFGSPA
eukprot:gb/GEZN01005596.1/.p1 GENE.gb/GEZN01005596.1/~~gb/GEZN01005596.1/.p1  ORF type:complete len:494 (-),score=101.83 gb/GEZN01005596.1/:230-1711(-)